MGTLPEATQLKKMSLPPPDTISYLYCAPEEAFWDHRQEVQLLQRVSAPRIFEDESK